MKLLIAGDFCPQKGAADLFEQNKFGDVLDDVKKIILDADYSIVNFECPICLGGEKPNLKRLSLFCKPSGLKAAKYAGLKCVTLANNHFRDWGDGGVNSTLKCCKNLNIDYVGGGENIEEASRVLYKTIGNEKLAVINCCEHEFSLATENRGGSNPLNPIRQFRAIQAARKEANYVIVIVHGGHEHFQLPSTRMQETYRFFIDAGADAVVNHHQHCISGYEIYNKKPIFYGIGNFCFDYNIANKETWYVGYMVALNLHSGGIDYEITPYVQCQEEMKIKIISIQEIQKQLDNLNAIIADPARISYETRHYYNDCMSSVESVIEPYTNCYIKGLRKRGLFPNIITKKWLMYLCNYVMCESHRDKLDYYFEKKIY